MAASSLSENSSPHERTTSFVSYVLFAAVLATAAAYSLSYLPFVADDALISYRYSDRFLHGHGLTWNDGEFVEGYSNLSWILLVAAGGIFHQDLISVGRLLCLCANGATLLAVFWTYARSSRISLVPVTSGLLTLSLSASFALWGIGGLETAFFAALLAWTLATTYRMTASGRGWIYPALLLGILAITRADGILFGISVPIALVVRGGFTREVMKRALALLVSSLAFTAGQIGFRLVYYGTFIPNTAYVKVAFTLERVFRGLLYTAWGAFINCIPLLILVIALFTLFRGRQLRALREVLLFIIPGVIWLAYVALIGGDFYPGNRHWLPALVCLAFALPCALESMPSVLCLHRTVITAAVAGAFTVHFASSFSTVNTMLSVDKGHLSVENTQFTPFMTEYESTCSLIGQLLHKAFRKQQPLLAVDAAGCLPFHSKLNSLDMLGLTDVHISHHRPPDMGKGGLGHELGDAVYVLSRKPDLLELAGPDGLPSPDFREEAKMGNTVEFRRDYRLVFFRSGAATERLWVRIENGPLGIVRDTDNIHVPGFLLATTPTSEVVLDSAGNPAARLTGGEAAIEKISFPVGTWDVSLTTDAVRSPTLSTYPDRDTEEVRPGVLRVVSDGTERSFYVLGGSGLLKALTATRVRNALQTIK